MVPYQASAHLTALGQTEKNQREHVSSGLPPIADIRISRLSATCMRTMIAASKPGLMAKLVERDLSVTLRSRGFGHLVPSPTPTLL